MLTKPLRWSLCFFGLACILKELRNYRMKLKVGESIHASMQLMSTTVNNQLSFSTTDTKRKKLKVAVNSDDFIVALPPEIRELILQMLDILDYHRFSAVCKAWRSISVIAKQNQHLSLQQLPWLMLSSNGSFQDTHHGFFCLRHGKTLKLKLPEVHGCRCCGSSWGWLIMENESGDNFLLNPFSRLQIQLPSQTRLAIVPDHFLPLSPDLQDWMKSGSYIRKAMLLTPPVNRCTASTTSSSDNVNYVSGNCIVVAIYACQYLRFCRLGDEAWTDLGKGQLQVSFEDVIFYNGQLYAVTNKYDLLLVELGTTYPKITRMNLSCPEGHDPFLSRGEIIYLVESCGELLMVVRIWYYGPSSIGDVSLPPFSMFKVFKLDSSGTPPRWVKVDGLGDQMLFVGTNSAISLSASHFSGFSGNCIYFTESLTSSFDYDQKVCCDLGIFRLDDGSIKSFFPNDFFRSYLSHSYLSPPIWYMPSQL